MCVLNALWSMSSLRGSALCSSPASSHWCCSSWGAVQNDRSNSGPWMPCIMACLKREDLSLYPSSSQSGRTQCSQVNIPLQNLQINCPMKGWNGCWAWVLLGKGLSQKYTWHNVFLLSLYETGLNGMNSSIWEHFASGSFSPSTSPAFLSGPGAAELARLRQELDEANSTIKQWEESWKQAKQVECHGKAVGLVYWESGEHLINCLVSSLQFKTDLQVVCSDVIIPLQSWFFSSSM